MDNKFLTILGVVTTALGVGSFIAGKKFGSLITRTIKQIDENEMVCQEGSGNDIQKQIDNINSGDVIM